MIVVVIILVMKITIVIQMLMTIHDDNNYNSSNNSHNAIYLGSHETKGKMMEHDGKWWDHIQDLYSWSNMVSQFQYDSNCVNSFVFAILILISTPRWLCRHGNPQNDGTPFFVTNSWELLVVDRGDIHWPFIFKDGNMSIAMLIMWVCVYAMVTFQLPDRWPWNHKSTVQAADDPERQFPPAWLKHAS